MDDAPPAAAASSASPWPGDATSVSSSSSPTSGPRSFVPDLPPGYHFLPTHDELVLHYLRPRLADQQLPLPIFFDERVLDYHPDRLIEKYREYGEDRWFFFAKRERKHEGGNRPNRATLDNGHWNATGSPRQVRSGGKVVGLVRTLVFYEASRRKKKKQSHGHGEAEVLPPEDHEEGKANKGVKTDWTMYEYESFTSEEELATCINGNAKMDVIVLCTIQKKKQKKTDGETKRKAKERGDAVAEGSRATGGKKPRKKSNETPVLDDQVPNLVVNFNADPNADMPQSFADVSPPVMTTPPPQETTSMTSAASGDDSQITVHPSTGMHHHYSIHAMASSQAQAFFPYSNSKMTLPPPLTGGNSYCSIMAPIRWTMDGSFASDPGTAPPQGMPTAAPPGAHRGGGGGGGGGFGMGFSNSGYGFAGGDGRLLSTTGVDFLGDVSSFLPFPPQRSYGSSTQESVLQNEVRVNLESFAASSMVGSEEWWRRFSTQGSSKKT